MRQERLAAAFKRSITHERTGADARQQDDEIELAASSESAKAIASDGSSGTSRIDGPKWMAAYEEMIDAISSHDASGSVHEATKLGPDNRSFLSPPPCR